MSEVGQGRTKAVQTKRGFLMSQGRTRQDKCKQKKINPKAEAKGLEVVRSGTNHVGSHLVDVPIADLQ